MALPESNSEVSPIPGAELAFHLFLPAGIYTPGCSPRLLSEDFLHGCFLMPSLGVSDSELGSIFWIDFFNLFYTELIP